MTEDEAKTKWCPMTLGRTPPNPEACGGSVCMAWRTTSADGAMEERITVLRPKGRGWQEIGRHVGGRAVWRRTTPATPTGFCGLAGAAQ